MTVEVGDVVPVIDFDSKGDLVGYESSLVPWMLFLYG